MNRKAFIDQILLWFIIIVFTVGFIGIIVDENDARAKIQKLQAITDHAVIAAGKYYANVNDDTDAAQNAANNIISTNTSDLAAGITINYTWDFVSDPNTITASIANHTHQNFWLKLFGVEVFQINNIDSTAKLIPQDDTIGDDVAPIGVNQCPLNLDPGDILTLDLGAHNLYDPNDSASFYALSDKQIDPNFNCAFGLGNAQASFTQFKQIIDDIVKGKINDDTTFDITSEYKPVANVCNNELISNDLANDLQQSSQSFGNSFPVYMSIIALGCASTDGNNLEYERIIPIKVTNVDYVKKTKFEITFEILSSPTIDAVLID